MNLNWFLLLIPLALGLSAFDADPVLTFFVSALTVIPLAQWLGDATEELAHDLGPSLGGLLNATMGTIPDIIIGIFALRHGLVEVVKAAITGSIVGNLLLGLGLAILLGGHRHPRGLRFDQTATHFLGGLMLLATIGLMIPAIFDFSTVTETEISLEVSVVLAATYALSVIFTLTSPPDEVDMSLLHAAKAPNPLMPRRRRGLVILVLVLATTLLALMSEVLTEAVEPAAKVMGLTPVFTGIFLLAPVGGAVELINAVRFARRDKLDLALATTMGSGTQMALLAAPCLVFTGLALGQPMNLLFGEFQVVAILLAMAAVNNVLNIGRVRWISGAKLIAVYAMLGIGFYYQP